MVLARRSLPLSVSNSGSRMKFSEITTPSPADVRGLRTKHRLTQTEAGNLVYVTLSAWQKWEGGKRTMDRRTWELLLYKLGEIGPPRHSASLGKTGRGTKDRL